MTPAEILAFSAPVSEDQPCGADLEMAGDADFMRFIARIEGVLPKSFAAFDRTSIDFPAEFATLTGLINQSRDLRLLTALAKLHILNRDLPCFVASTQVIATLIDAQWERIFPELLDGDAILRIVSLQTLDDMPDAVMPLQSAPLFETRRFGKASFRSHLLATGQIQARTAAGDDDKDEETPSPDALRTAIAETNLDELVITRDLIVDLKAALTHIETLANEKSGQPNAVRFEKLAPLAQDIVLYLDEAISARDPARGLSPGSAGAAGGQSDGEADVSAPVGRVQSLADASSALAAAATYFVKAEPSSPILMLIAQAEALIGKSFFEAMQALAPDLSGQATIRIGKDVMFRLPLERLSSLTVTTMDEPPEEPAPEEESASEAYENEVETSWAEPSEEEAGASEEAGETAESESSEGENSGENEQESDAEPEPEADTADESSSEPESDAPASSAPAHTPRAFRALSRQEAVALLGQVATYFRAVEPSSPVPTLLDHAGQMAGRDFFGLLRDLLPATALES